MTLGLVISKFLLSHNMVIPVAERKRPVWTHNPWRLFPGLSKDQRWETYAMLRGEWMGWKTLTYRFHLFNSICPLTQAREDNIWQKWYDIRDAFLTYEGVDSDHPDIPSIIHQQKGRLRKLYWQRNQEALAWDAEMVRIAALPKKIAPPPRPAPSTQEMARRRAQSQATKKSNGIDYSISKRQRQRLRDERSDEEDEYSCDPKAGYCGAIEPDWCHICKIKTNKRAKVDEQPSASFA